MNEQAVKWEYNAPGPICKAFLRSNAFVRGIRGPIGSGKSTACAVEIGARSAEQAPSPDGKRRTRWAVIRNTYPELKTTTIKSWHQWFPPTLGKWTEQGPPTHLIEDANISMEVMFVALDRADDISKLLSMELTGAWINEAREIPKAVFDGLTGRVGRFPPMRDGGPTWSGIIMDTNPPDMDHWWYKLAEETRPDDFEFFSQPSGLDPAAENLHNLPPEYYRRAALGKSDEWIKIYVKGDYGFVMDGKPIYDQYRDNLHIVECEYSPMLPIHIGMDFGLTPAATIAQRSIAGQTRVLSELTATRLGAKLFARELKEHLAQNYGAAYKIGSITGDPAGNQSSQTDETTVFQMLKSEGVVAFPAQTNDFEVRREAVNSSFRTLIDGQPALVISPRCTGLRKGCAGGYYYRRVQIATDERYEDKPYKNMSSHVCEALQYLMLGLGVGRDVIRRPEAMMSYNDPRPKFAEGTGVIKDF